MHDKKSFLKFGWGDAVAVAAVLLLAAACVWASSALLSSNGDGRVAVIKIDGETVETIDLNALSQPLYITPDVPYACVIAAENGRICVRSSECHSNDCVNTGWISQPGQVIICLPNRLVITVSGEGGADIAAG